MPEENKELPEITDDGLDTFVEKLLNRIADESEEGKKALLSTMAIAQSLYNKPLESWLGWIYVFTRTRGPKIVGAMKSIEAFPDAYTRLQEIKLLVEEDGEWHPNSSYNYYLFVELIKSVPGYKPLEDELVHPITIKIKNKIINKIDSFMYQYKANQLSIASREKEREATRQSMQKSIDKVLRFDNLDEAQLSAKKNPAEVHFCLTLIKQTWHLLWVDIIGKAYKLSPTDELISLLANGKAPQDEQLQLIHETQLKKECLKARDIFLAQVQLLINPKDPATHIPFNNESLIATGVVATFILRGKPNQYSLYWISTLGKATEISLATYPQFKKWLDSQSSLGETHLPQLKAYLLGVKTAKTLTGMEDFKKELQDCLAQGPQKAISTTSQKTAPKPLKMSLFADIAKCVEEQHGKPQIKELTPKTEPAIASEEVSGSEEIPDSPEIPLSPKVSSRLQLDKYASLSQIFSQRGKQIVEPIDETQSGYQPS